MRIKGESKSSSSSQVRRASSPGLGYGGAVEAGSGGHSGARAQRRPWPGFRDGDARRPERVTAPTRVVAHRGRADQARRLQSEARHGEQAWPRVSIYAGLARGPQQIRNCMGNVAWPQWA